MFIARYILSVPELKRQLSISMGTPNLPRLKKGFEKFSPARTGHHDLDGSSLDWGCVLINLS
jgi:hypothetical protein